MGLAVIPLMTAHDRHLPTVRARIAHETESLALNFLSHQLELARHVKGRCKASEDTERSEVPQRP